MRYLRTPPATVASTTSLTVPPSRFLTSLTSSRSLTIVAYRRFGPTLPLSGVFIACDSHPEPSE